MTSLQKTLVTATVALLAGAGIYENRQAAQMRQQNQTLQQQQAPLTEQIRQLQFERDGTSNRLALLLEQNVKLKGNQNELLRLRGEIGQLRRELESATNQVNQPKETQATARHTPGSYISKGQLANAGYVTPEAAVETMTWALLNGTYEQAIESMSPKLLAAESKDAKGREEFEEGKTKAAATLKGIQILAEKVLADDKVELKVMVDEDPVAMSKLNLNLPPVWVQPMVRIGNEWKVDGPERPYNETWDQEGKVQSFLQK